MGKKCSLKNCKNYQKEPSYGCEISFHGLPKNEEIKKKWMEAIPKDLIRAAVSNICVCSAHFTTDSYQPACLGLTKNMLHRTAVPSIFEDAKEINVNNSEMDVVKEKVIIIEEITRNRDKVNFVNASNKCVYVITETKPPTVSSETSTRIASKIESNDIGIQVSLPTQRERLLQRKLCMMQKRLERREARIKSIMMDFKTLMDQS